ncbi:MAG TPA: hypothetical protein VIH30_03960, partial [Aquirhabdus sp.]
SINMTDNTNEFSTDAQGNSTLVSTGEQSVKPAVFTNFYDFVNILKNTYAVGKKTPADNAVTARSVGTVAIALNSCYVPPVGR